MLPRLAPPPASRPPPSERRRSISTASIIRLETIVRPLSFSCQRKAGMSWLLPSSRPAWLAPVCEERSHSQPSRRWLPCSIQRAMVGTCPSSRARRSTGSASPSISNRITPGTSVRFFLRALRARRRTTRNALASGSMPTRGVSSISTRARKKATAIAPSRLGSAPSTISRARVMMIPLTTSEARPKVRIVSGSATLISSGQSSALRIAIVAVASSAVPKRGTPMPGTIAASIRKASAVRTQSARPRSRREPSRRRFTGGPSARAPAALPAAAPRP